MYEIMMNSDLARIYQSLEEMYSLLALLEEQIKSGKFSPQLEKETREFVMPETHSAIEKADFLLAD